ncbi:benzoate-CoA ligase family protein [Streptomyces sp. A7024]|uniref:Benzoate-CoA ligase family protein n=1 Tax=Streptomyces coryli TaxID=1128680 RepID=A0A6G4TYH1_9ACTN|nr:benzoate-CoA ligase family protein [Streptomyces coryli]NGN64168.1 benzoate-CoA ligase family protein [Streptomyces coryli]
MSTDAFNACTYLIDRQLERGRAGHPAVTGPAGTLTYAELARDVSRLAAGLRAAGLRPEERMVLFASDGPRMLTALLAAMRLGAVPVPVSTMYNAEELAALLADSRARMLLATGEFAGTAAKALAQTEGVTDFVAAGDDEPPGLPEGVRLRRWAALLAEGARRTGDFLPPYPAGDDFPALWLYTSGTTGTPKAAIHRHAALRHVCETYADQVLGLTADDICWSASKLFFAYGLGVGALFPLAAGATTVLLQQRSTPDAAAEVLAAHRPTVVAAGPTFIAALLAAELPAEVFAPVRAVTSAGEPLPAELYRRFHDRFGVEVLDGLGSTEMLHIFLSNRPGAVRPGTTGVPVPGYALQLVDAAGAPVTEPDAPGRLLVSGPSAALGYWCRDATTRRVFRGEWLDTGDTYSRSADGYYTCLGRSSDLIKAGGIWVSPAEVEARLMRHPGVLQAAVVAAPDADRLEKPVACVVPQPGAEPTEAELIAYCREGLAHFKCPRKVLLLAELPITPTGKIRRVALRERVRDVLLPSPSATA